MTQGDGGASPVSSPKAGDFTREKARERAYQSQVKGLLYGGEVAEETKHEGKKSIHQRTGGIPFATYDGGASQQLPASGTHVALHKKAGGAGKIGSTDFDPAVYRNNLAANAANIAASKQKNWSSAQVMPQQDSQDVKTAPYEIGTIIETPKSGLLLTGANPFKE